MAQLTRPRSILTFLLRRILVVGCGGHDKGRLLLPLGRPLYATHRVDEQVHEAAHEGEATEDDKNLGKPYWTHGESLRLCRWAVQSGDHGRPAYGKNRSGRFCDFVKPSRPVFLIERGSNESGGVLYWLSAATSLCRGGWCSNGHVTECRSSERHRHQFSRTNTSSVGNRSPGRI